MWRFGKDGAYRQHDGLQTRFGSAVSLCTPRRAHGVECWSGATCRHGMRQHCCVWLFVGSGWCCEELLRGF